LAKSGIDLVGPLMDRASEALLSNDDTGAKIAIGIGTFIVVTDLSYRAMHIKVSIPRPQGPGFLSDLKDPLAWAATQVAGPVGLGGYEIYKNWDYVSNLYNSVMPKIDISTAMDPNKGMWDMKITMMGMGLVAAGVAMWIANHPEIVMEGIKFVKSSIRESLDIAEQAVIEQVKASGPNASTDNLGAALKMIPAIL
jgi:hypothetical protein